MLRIGEDDVRVFVQDQLILWRKKWGLILGKGNRFYWFHQMRRVKKRLIDKSLMFKILGFYLNGWVYLDNQLPPICLVNDMEDKIVIVF